MLKNPILLILFPSKCALLKSYNQHSLRPRGICTARPPSEVSLYLLFMSWAVFHIVLMTASRETLAKSGVLWRASWEAVMALIAPMVLRSMQGIWTRPPMGSQVRPRWCSMAISAAIMAWRWLPPTHSVRAAAAMAELTPISAWQPPIAAEMVAPFLKMLPISEAVQMNCWIFSSL